VEHNAKRILAVVLRALLMTSRRRFLGALATGSLLHARWAQAGAINQIGGVRSVTRPTGLIESTPLGDGGFTLQKWSASSGASANGDGTTGWTAGSVEGGWTILQRWWNCPEDQFYQFVIPAWASSFAGIPSNSLQIYIDQLMLPSDAGTIDNFNWFIQFVSNPAPSRDYSFTGPIRAGWHSVQIYMCNACYTGTGAVNGQTHCDRLNIIATGIPLPAEPAGDRDPIDFPLSSHHFLNTPFGTSATWLALDDPVAQTVNGTGGNGAHIAINASAYSSSVWVGRSTDPVFSVSTSDHTYLPTSPIDTPIPVRGPAGLYQSLDTSDMNMAMIDATNPRYAYSGIGASVSGRTASFYRVAIRDNYNLNHAIPQSYGNMPGIIRVADLDSGTIQHRLLGGLGFPAVLGVPPSGYAPARQTSQWSGLPWPGCESDAEWKSAGEYVNPSGVPYASVGGIPPSEAKPGRLNAATSMMWDCLQNFGVFFNVTSGTYPQITIYAEGSANGHPLLSEIAWNSIVPHLSIMSNPAPIVAGDGFGGGAPKVPLLPGLRQGYPPISRAPYSFPPSPMGIPIGLAGSKIGIALPSGMAVGSATASIPAGSFVFVILSLDRAAAVDFATVVDSAGNKYRIFQPPRSSSIWQPALAVCLSTSHPIVDGTTWTATLTSAATANYQFLGAYYRPAPPTGKTWVRASNTSSTASSAKTFSCALKEAQINDLIVALTYVSAYAEIADPVGMGSLCNVPPMTVSFQLATTSGPFTYGPAWNNPAPAAVVVAAFANANTET
jgi:hypothetical protein